MNIKNMYAVIDMMQRAAARDSVYMPSWQSDSVGEYSLKLDIVTSEEELHACGNRACFAGHIAVCAEFRAAGGSSNRHGMPVIRDKLSGNLVTGTHAVAEWLEISWQDAVNLVHGQTASGHSLYYEKPWDQVTAADVVVKLTTLLEEKMSL